MWPLPTRKSPKSVSALRVRIHWGRIPQTPSVGTASELECRQRPTGPNERGDGPPRAPLRRYAPMSGPGCRRCPENGFIGRPFTNCFLHHYLEERGLNVIRSIDDQAYLVREPGPVYQKADSLPPAYLPCRGFFKVFIEPRLQLAYAVPTQLRYLLDSMLPFYPPAEPDKPILVTSFLRAVKRLPQFLHLYRW